MITPELIEYVKKQLKSGQDWSEIKGALILQGWSEADLSEAQRATQPPVISSLQPVVPADPLASADPVSDADLESIYRAAGVSSGPSFGKKTLLTIGLAVFLVLLAAGAAAYFFYFQSPEVVMSKMMEKSAQAKAGKYNGDLVVELEVWGSELLGSLLSGSPSPAPTGSPVSAKVVFAFQTSFELGSDTKDRDHPRTYFTLNLVNKDEPVETRKSLFGLEFRQIDKTFYFQMTELPTAIVGPALAGLKGQWVKLDTAEMAAQLRQRGLEKEAQEMEDASKNREFTQEKINQVNALAKKYRLVKVTAKLPSEKIDGQGTHHYRYVIEKDPLKKFVLELNQLMEAKELTAEEQQSFNEVFDSLLAVGGELWIGKKDFLPLKQTIKIEIRAEKDGVKVAGKIDATLLGKDFNKPIALETPQNTQSFDQFFGVALGGLFGGLASPVDCTAKPVSERDQCYYDQALTAIGASSDCERIVSLSKRNDCYYEFAKKSSDEWVCSQIKGAGSQGWKDECYRAVAGQTTKADLCQKVINLDWRNYCLASASRDGSYCQQIKKISTKEKCRQDLQSQAPDVDKTI